MDKTTIFLVEDDTRLSALIQEYLTAQGFRVLPEYRGDLAGRRILDENPDLVILDLMLPGKDGLTVCQEIRPHFPGPLLILTAREDDMDQVAGLEMGADDYVKKPVIPRVLLARIRALLRRATPSEQSESPEEVRLGALRINRRARTVQLDGREIELGTMDFDLLWTLSAQAGTIVDRNTLYRQLRGIEYDGLDRAMDLAVSRLRCKLDDDARSPRKIKTVWGQGYLLVPEAWISRSAQ